MIQLAKLVLVVSALTSLAAPVSAQMITSKGSIQQANRMKAMMPECSAMMKEFMADPVVQKRMMAIMEKHMKQHAGQAAMMSGMSGNKAAAPNVSATSDPAAHAAHHPAAPVVSPDPAVAPMPVPSPQ